MYASSRYPSGPGLSMKKTYNGFVFFLQAFFFIHICIFFLRFRLKVNAMLFIRTPVNQEKAAHVHDQR